MKNKIEDKIFEYLLRETTMKFGFLNLPQKVEFSGDVNAQKFTHVGFCQEIAAAIAAAIAPLVDVGEPDWENAPEWAKYRTVDNDGDVTFWEYKPICSLLGIWLQSSDGGRFTTVSPNRSLQQRPQ